MARPGDRGFMPGRVANARAKGNNGGAGCRITTSPNVARGLDLQADLVNSDDEGEAARRDILGRVRRSDVNNWYAVDRLGAAHRADLVHEAAGASLAVSARRGEATVRVRTMSRLRRAARGAVIALGLALVVAAPAAAARPTRTVYELSLVSHYPAGSGCTFDVTAYKEPGSHVTVTKLSGGTVVYESHSMHRIIVNDATGATFAQNLEYHDAEWTDPATGVIHGLTSGQSLQFLLPGDIMPDGAVVSQTVTYQVWGTQRWTWDPATGQTVFLSYTGTLTDICAAIS
jgi:hypothetical protein